MSLDKWSQDIFQHTLYKMINDNR